MKLVHFYAGCGLLNILLVEDERKLADAVAEGLQEEGYVVTLSPTGEDALSSIRCLHFDLILLEIGRAHV